MKKTYNTPEVKVVEIENKAIIAVSANNQQGNGSQMSETYRSNLWGED